MQQHPVPQNITTYQFRLVGDMTLKQFLELAGGIVLAWIIFSSNLNFLFKWTLAPFFGFLGFALAFVPIEDLPLDQWIINFIKAVYSPTQYVFQPTPKTLDIFAPAKPRPVKSKAQSPQPEQLEEYLKTLPSSPTTAFEQAEEKYLAHLTNLFDALGAKAPPSKSSPSSPKTFIEPPIKGVRIRQLMTPQMCLLPHATVYQPPAPTQQASMPIISQPSPPQAPTKKASPAITKPAPKITVKPKTVRPPVRAPSSPPKSTTAAVFAPDVIIPQAAEKPNLVSGITLDKNNKIIPNVILEIRDSKGYPVRALKSNKLGQFFTATPLPDGVYTIEAEHDAHRFAIMKLEAKNEIIPPLKIQAI